MKRGKTVKRRSKSLKSSKKSVLTIPELRKGLDYIQHYTSSLVKSGGKSVSEMASQFAAEWKKVFGKTLSKDTAEAYIRNMFDMKKKFKTTRKQRGGAQNTLLTGAPMDYMTRPGADIPYGVFTKHVTSGFWNPEPAIQYDCGTQKGDLPMPGMGSNKMNGGAIFTGSPIRFSLAENPTTILNDAQTVANGQLLGPGPASYDTAYSYKSTPETLNSIYASGAYSRVMSNDVRT
jgi:hypothetical protein